MNPRQPIPLRPEDQQQTAPPPIQGDIHTISEEQRQELFRPEMISLDSALLAAISLAELMSPEDPARLALVHHFSKLLIYVTSIVATIETEASEVTE